MDLQRTVKELEEVQDLDSAALQDKEDELIQTKESLALTSDSVRDLEARQNQVRRMHYHHLPQQHGN